MKDLIIERVPYYSDEQMVEYCQSMLDVLVTGNAPPKSGKKKVKKEVTVSKDAIDRLKVSIEYYGDPEKYLLMQIENNSEDPSPVEDDVIDEEEYDDDTSDFFENDVFVPRDYQVDISDNAAKILKEHGFVYLSMEVRTGKTLTAFMACEKIEQRSMLFITKKKAMSSITSDYNKMAPDFDIDVVNWESLHKYAGRVYGVIVADEAHKCGKIPKPSRNAKLLRDMIINTSPHVILMSGTPTPESYSQMYHQVYGLKNNPFREFKNFYRFADVYVDVKERMINSMRIKDYTRGRESILEAMKPYTISYTQNEAGFKSKINEHILYCVMAQQTYDMANKLKKDLVIQGKNEVVLGDTAVKLMTKLQQIYSGTVKFESGNSMFFDKSKGEFIQRQFDGLKIAIFYKFKEELNVLKAVFADNLTEDIAEFDSSDKNIALQIVSGREGISLRNAEYIVYYNIDFSATSYWQSRDRMTTIDRPSNDVYWIFTHGSLDAKVYSAVVKKKDYTVNHFKKDLKLL